MEGDEAMMRGSDVRYLGIAQALGAAYQIAPSGWLRRYGRIDNRVRSTVRNGAIECMGKLEHAVVASDRADTIGYWGAEQALLTMRRVGEGVDPRGGTERDQMVTAMDAVAREMAHALARIEDGPL